MSWTDRVLLLAAAALVSTGLGLLHLSAGLVAAGGCLFAAWFFFPLVPKGDRK